MKNDEFVTLVEKALRRSNDLLEKKGKQYTTEDGDRLGQFKKAASLLSGGEPIKPLINMAVKHFAKLVDMAAHPHDFTPEEWIEVLDDARNYTLLAEGVLADSGVL